MVPRKKKNSIGGDIPLESSREREAATWMQQVCLAQCPALSGRPLLSPKKSTSRLLGTRFPHLPVATQLQCGDEFRSQGVLVPGLLKILPSSHIIIQKSKY